MSITIKIEIDGLEVVNQKVEETKNVESRNYSQYARFFDETSPYWNKNSGLRENDGPEMNLFFLLAMQDRANVILKSRYNKETGEAGYLFLNEVYDILGLPKSKAGQIVGWVYDKENPIGDNYVDFGIYKTEKNAKFVNGFENSILLDFNVDGPIIDKI